MVHHVEEGDTQSSYRAENDYEFFIGTVQVGPNGPLNRSQDGIGLISYT